MKILHTKVYNFYGAFRGMRNPLESWDKSDSQWHANNENGFIIGQKDLKLAHNLIKAGSSDSKFLRQIFVCADVTAPLYWYSEYDTYKVGTVANSTSKMHKLATTPISIDYFQMDDFNNVEMESLVDVQQYWDQTIAYLEELRQAYLNTKDIRYWKELIRVLPESWLQTRTVTLNYANLRNMYFQRKNHKLTEWHTFCNWIEKLPYATDLITYTG